MRKRHYHETKLTYLEVKFKNNRGETSKYRFKSSYLNRNTLTENYENIIPILNFNPNTKLLPAVNIDYKRITLIKPDEFDKITIDYDLSFSTTDGSTIRLPNLIILEHKSKTKSGYKSMPDVFSNIDYKKISLSKYCLGLTLTNPLEKYNLYKSKLITINKICNGINTTNPQFPWNDSFSRISG